MGLGCIQAYCIVIVSATWAAVGLNAFYPNSSVAQITPDATLPNNSNVNEVNKTLNITGGSQVGSNLFHSFKDFSVPSGWEAFFNNGADIQNILTRVTGKSISEIDGLIKANGSANLFLMNPNGIVFGENARLDIGGSFLGTSADSMNFSDGSEFSAVNPQSKPLLTVNVPSGLQYGTNPGSIQVQNSLEVQSGKTLALLGGDINLEGATLETAGGRIELGSVAENSLVNLEFVDSRWLADYQDVKNFRNIRLLDETNILVNGDGKGSIGINANNIDIRSDSNIQAGIDADFQLLDSPGKDITLNASGIITVDNGRIANEVAEGGIGNDGNINITGQSVFLYNGTAISTNSFGRGNTGSITINARDTISLDGGSSRETVISASLLGTGNGGKIAVNAPKVSLSNGIGIVAHSFGRGNAGSIEISAVDRVLINGAGTGVGNQVFADAVGNGGTININTPDVTISDSAIVAANSQGRGNGGKITFNASKVSLLTGATVVAHTFAQGNAGNITVNANQVLLDGVDSEGGSSGLGSAAFELESGKGGEILVNTDTLDVTNGATLFASSFGKEDSGSVRVNATGAVTFDGIGKNGFSSNAFTTIEADSLGNGREISINADSLKVANGAVIGAKTSGQGRGGDITINVNQLQLENGGQILTTSRGSGNAGNISINATQKTDITGSDDNFPQRLARIGRPIVRNEGAQSGIFANTDVDSTGSGGNIDITTGDLSINEGALINATNQGSGLAGNINAQTSSIRLDNNAAFTANTQSINQDLNKPQANINISNSQDLILRRGSNITTNATGENVIGGNINIDSGVVTVLENSRISANSNDFRGGRVNIDTQGIYGTQAWYPEAYRGYITATGATPLLSGEIEVNTELDPTRALTELPVNLVDASNQISNACTPRDSQFQNEFIVTGRGGLPMNPTQPLQENSTLSTWVKLKPQPLSTNTTIEPQPRTVSNHNKVAPRNQIVEATGWIVDKDGNIEFVAQANQINPQNTRQTPASCSLSR